jgi:CRP-like cAMP-binding protein
VCRVMMVGSGAVRLGRVTGNGKETLLRLEFPGDWVGDTVSSHQFQSGSVCARGATVLLTWDLSAFQELLTCFRRTGISGRSLT